MKFDITLNQYELIYKIVTSVGANFAHGAGRSCQFYNVNGAVLMNQVLKVKCRPVMGAAFIRLNDDGDTLSFAGEENGDFYSSPDAFHCWVETPNNFIDFTAPEYREAACGMDNRQTIPRKMFQKPKSAMSNDPHTLSKEGDFFFCANNELTSYLLEKMAVIRSSQDFADMCLEWYKKNQKKKVDSFDVMNDLGELTHVKIIQSNLKSGW